MIQPAVTSYIPCAQAMEGGSIALRRTLPLPRGMTCEKSALNRLLLLIDQQERVPLRARRCHGPGTMAIVETSIIAPPLLAPSPTRIGFSNIFWKQLRSSKTDATRYMSDSKKMPDVQQQRRNQSPKPNGDTRAAWNNHILQWTATNPPLQFCDRIGGASELQM